MNNNKLKDVQDWLASLYDYSGVDFEVNNETTNILLQLMSQIKLKEERNVIIQDDIKQHILEIEYDLTQMNQKLSLINSTVDLLPFKGKQVLESLAEIAVSLNLKSPQMSSYLTALSDLMDSHELLSKTIDDIDDDIEHSRSCSVKYLEELTFSKKLLTHQEKLDVLLEKTCKAQSKELDYFHAKQKQYHNSIAESREAIKNSGVSTSITHSSLVSKFQELEKLKNSTNLLTSKLNAFHNLPPDLTLAKIQLDQKQSHLRKLQAEVDLNIDSMNNWNPDSYE